ncbi:hypothetical protein RF11_06300 [Thelohanellus kitauei]|uniref:Uncharacterized protein n=1 Tax=Thelohanellus kitauei TaxID=669202 RepID=A0A0C2JFP6_THEKT|nr:hypothetical protein RF11_06300 [Thelohanellus kitauei]
MLSWSHATRLVSLRAGLESELSHIINSRTNLDTVLDALLTEAFPASNRYHNERELQNINQDSLWLISDYSRNVSFQLEPPKLKLTAEGKNKLISPPNPKLQCTLEFNQFAHYEFTKEFVLINGELQDVLLGSLFLNRNDLMINYRSKPEVFNLGPLKSF